MSVQGDVNYSLNPATVADVDAAAAATPGLRLMGYVASSAAGAVCAIVHGATGAGGDAVIPLNLAAGGNPNGWFTNGIPMPNGISIDRVSGTFDLTLFYNTIS